MYQTLRLGCGKRIDSTDVLISSPVFTSLHIPGWDEEKDDKTNETNNATAEEKQKSSRLLPKKASHSGLYTVAK